MALENQLIRAAKFRVRNGYGRTLIANWDEADSAITVLKPHGSVNWIASLFQVATSGVFTASNSLGQRPFVDNTDLSFDDYPKRVLDESFRGGGVAQAATLILPTFEKDFSVRTSLGVEWIEFYESLWSQAVEALERSDRVVIVGYSMPPADHRACAMLLWNANRKAEILVCCSSSNESLRKRFSEHGFMRVRKVGSFVDLLSI